MALRAVDLCCGVGGLSYGLMRAGVDVRLGVDVSESAQHAYEHNVNTEYRRQDLFDLPVGLVRARLRGPAPRLVAACAPCQPFSEINPRRQRDRSKGETLLGRLHELARSLKPEFLVFENVPGAATSNAIAEVKRDLLREGYTVRIDVIDAGDLGVPQTRRRMLLFAIRLTRELPDSWFRPSQPRRDVRSAIGDLPRLGAGDVDIGDPLHRAAALRDVNVERIRASVPGSTWETWPRRLQLACHRRGNGPSFREAYGQMDWDRPAPTITTKFYNYGSGRFGHPEQDRAISAREAARLQEFPDEFRFAPPEAPMRLSELGPLIGNAVPMSLSRWIGERCESIAHGHLRS